MAFVGGTQSFKLAMDRLKAAVDEFPNEFRNEVQQELQRVTGDLRSSAVSTLPKRGGLATVIAGSSSDVRETASGVRLTASSQHDIASIDRGRLRHPLFGNRERWYSQAVPPGWWSIPIERSKPSIQDAANRALETTKTKAGG